MHSSREAACVCVAAAQLNRRVRQLTTTAESKTKDNVFVSVAVATQYKLIEAKANEAFYSMKDPMSQLQSYIFDVIRAAVPKLLLDQVFESKAAIATEIRAHLSETMAAHGFEIIDVLVIDIAPDPVVKKSMNSINAEKRLRKAAEHRAEAEKLIIVKGAEANAEYQYLQGVGIARQRHVLVEGIRNSLSDVTTKANINSKQVMELVIVSQYCETIKAATSRTGSKVVFITDENDEMKSMRNTLLEANLQGRSGR
eukprot:Selendium_serpulae@DN5054_c0_g1_i1.p1